MSKALHSVDPVALTRAGYSALPLPLGSKYPPPDGWTGKDAPMASMADVTAWLEEDAYGNVAVRLPAGVVGLDVDAYGGKDGAETWEALTGGSWPQTVVVSAREDGVSGIRLYRLPSSVAEGDLWGSHGNLDVIRHGHRYLVGPGSIHPEGGLYRVTDERTGETSTSLPRTKDLPALSPSQALRLTKRGAPWASEGSGPLGAPGALCDHLTARLGRTLSTLGNGHARHDTMTREVLALVRLGERGHPGMDQALIMLEGAYLAAVSTSPRDGETPADVRHEFRRMVEGAEAICRAEPTPPAERGCREADTADTEDTEEEVLPPTLPLEFWAARPSLTHVRMAARSRLAGSDGLLLSVLVRVACSLDPAWVLPPIVEVPASANLYGALVLGSGGGKSSAKALAAEVLPLPAPLVLGLEEEGSDSSRGTVREVTMGTGEGLVDSMGDGGTEWVKREWALLVDSDEVDAFLGAAGQGAGTTAMLRTAWSGGALGGTYRGKASKARAAAQDYRLGLLLGAQPRRTGALLTGREADGGTPQRFVWLTALLDADLTEETIPDWPGALEWEPWAGYGKTIHGESTHAMVDTHGREVTRYGVRVAPEVQREVRRSHLAQKRSMSGSLDAHRNLLRLKTALALGLLERGGAEPEVTEEDWRLAGMLLDTSDGVREWIADQAAEAGVQAEVDRRRTIRAGERTAEETIERVAGVLERAMVRHGHQSLKDLRGRLRHADRHWLKDALAWLEHHGRAQRKGKGWEVP